MALHGDVQVVHVRLHALPGVEAAKHQLQLDAGLFFRHSTLLQGQGHAPVQPQDLLLAVGQLDVGAAGPVPHVELQDVDASLLHADGVLRASVLSLRDWPES